MMRHLAAALWAFVAVTAIAATGCEKRDRSNPFDPRNPDTHGVPGLLDATAGNAEVRLDWSVAGIDDLGTAYLLRGSPGDTAETTLTPEGVAAFSGTFLDESVINGSEYLYRMEFRLTSGVVLSTSAEAARPGDRVVWVADSDGGGLIRVSPDGRDIVLRAAQGEWLLDLAVDRAEKTVWTVDYLAGSLESYGWGGALLSTRDVPGARALALDPDGESVWVASFSQGILEHRRIEDGRVAWADSVAGPVEDLLFAPIGVLWAASAEGTLRLYEDDRLISVISELGRPVALAPADGDVLVLDRNDGRVRRYDPYGIPRGRSEAVLEEPTDIAPDGSGGAWVADASRGGIIHFDRRLAEVGSIDAPGSLGVAFDPRDSTLWCVGSQGLRVFTTAGAEVARADLGGRCIGLEIVHQ